MSTIKVFYLSVGMAITGYVVLFVLMLTGTTSMAALLIPGVFIFIAFGCLTVLTTVFLANTVDYGEVKNGRRDESVIFSMQTFVVKLASGVSAFIASICLTICNLSNDTSNVVVEVAKESNVMGLRFTMSVLPIIGLVVALVLFAKKYILTDAKLEEINHMKKN